MESKLIKTYAADFVLSLGRLLGRGLLLPWKSWPGLLALPPTRPPSRARLSRRCPANDREVGVGGARLLISARQAALTRQTPRVPARRHSCPVAFPASCSLVPQRAPEPATPARGARRRASLGPQAWDPSPCHQLQAAPGLLLAAPPPPSHSTADLKLRPEPPLATRHYHLQAPLMSLPPLPRPQGSGSELLQGRLGVSTIRNAPTRVRGEPPASPKPPSTPHATPTALLLQPLQISKSGTPAVLCQLLQVTCRKEKGAGGGWFGGTQDLKLFSQKN